MKTQTISLALIGFALFILAGIIMLKPLYQAEGSAFTGQAAHLQIATTTTLTANTNANIFNAVADESCKARVVTVPGSMTGGINLVFGVTTNGDLSTSTLSATAGHYQAASTTEVYDSGLYGCGTMAARSWTTGVITVSAF